MEPAVLLDTVTRSSLQLIEPPTGFRYPDDRHVKVAALHHRLQRREDLLVSEIARAPKKISASERGSLIVGSSCGRVAN
jgi:hypothetical protein